jgi:hypothetical protein
MDQERQTKVELKNQIVFGEAGLSSWMPNYLFEQTGNPVPLEQRKALGSKGCSFPLCRS